MRASAKRIGHGFRISNRRKSANASAVHAQPAGVNSRTSAKAAISSHTMPPWSATPSARPVRPHAHTPMRKAAMTRMMRFGRSGAAAAISQNSGRPSRVPTVPGAFGASPLPNPNATRWAGCRSRKRTSALSPTPLPGAGEGLFGEVVIAGLFKLQRPAVGIDDGEAGLGGDAADARHRHAGRLRGGGDRVAPLGGRGEAELVVVAAR